MQFNFIQSNWLRQYPFRAEHGKMDLVYNQMPTDLIVGLRITVPPNNTEVYINKVTTNNGIVSVSFYGTVPIGFASGVISTSNQSLSIKNFNNGVIGNIIIGNIDSTKAPQSFIFDATNGLVEGSTIMVLPPPIVPSISIKDQKMTGMVTLASDSVSINTGATIDLSVLHPNTITSRGDVNASTLTCSKPVIAGINTVKPDRNNNIDIYAITPLTISTEVVDGIPQLRLSTPSLNYENLCKTYNIPPEDTTEVSHTPIETITKAEWEGWPQFN